MTLDVEIYGRNMEITDRISDYVEKKVSKYPITMASSPEITVEIEGTVARTKNAGSEETFPVIRAANGTTAGTTGTTRQSSWTTKNLKYQTLTRSIFYFDTSAIPEQATILSVSLLIHGNHWLDVGSNSPTYNFYQVNTTNDDDIIISDYNISKWTTTSCLDTDIDASNFNFDAVNPAENTLVFNNYGISIIVKEGITKIGVREKKHDVNNVTPGTLGNAMLRIWAAEKGTSYEPTLIVSWYTGNVFGDGYNNLAGQRISASINSPRVDGVSTLNSNL